MDGLDGAKELQSGVDATTRRGRNLAREIILVLAVVLIEIEAKNRLFFLFFCDEDRQSMTRSGRDDAKLTA